VRSRSEDADMSLVTNNAGVAHLDASHEDDEGLAKARLPVSNVIAIGWLIALSLVALFADVLPFADPKDTHAGKPLSGPSGHNWLGTDQLGRDLFSRSVYGARVSIVVGIAAVLLSPRFVCWVLASPRRHSHYVPR